MIQPRHALAATLLAIAGGPAAAQDAPTAVALDTGTTVGGVAVGCSGIGEAKADPRWLAYPIRVEFADAARDYLANGAVSVSDAAGHLLASVSCDGPWILLRPAGAGAYRIKGWLPGSAAKPQTGAFHIPSKGQTRLVLTFPDA